MGTAVFLIIGSPAESPQLAGSILAYVKICMANSFAIAAFLTLIGAVIRLTVNPDRPLEESLISLRRRISVSFESYLVEL